MTAERLAEIQARLESIEGYRPYEWWHEFVGGIEDVLRPFRDAEEAEEQDEHDEREVFNGSDREPAAFAAQAPRDIRDLLDYVVELQVKVEQMKQDGVYPVPRAASAGSISASPYWRGDP